MKNMKQYCRCNKCGSSFQEYQLIKIEDEMGISVGCRNCKTDKYLMDLEKENSLATLFEEMNIEYNCTIEEIIDGLNQIGFTYKI